jgi:hypothetical protein
VHPSKTGKGGGSREWVRKERGSKSNNDKKMACWQEVDRVGVLRRTGEKKEGGRKREGEREREEREEKGVTRSETYFCQ